MEVWIGRDGERHGPYKDEDIRQWLRSGQVSPDDLAWFDGLADWQALSVLFPDEVRDSASPPPFASHGPPASSTLPSETIGVLQNYASFGQRLGAWGIDYLLLLIPTMIVSINMGAVAIFERFLTQYQAGNTQAALTAYAEAISPTTLVVLLIGFAYYALFECSKWQATPGKMAFGLRVTDLQGNRLGIGRSMARNAVRLLNAITVIIPFVAFIVVIWTQNRQGLHDMLAKTLVLNGKAAAIAATTTKSDSSNGSFSA